MRTLPAERLSGARRRCRMPGFEPAFRRLKAEAEAFLGLDMRPPDEPAGYYHAYFCPEHGVELAFDPARPYAHRCPKDGKVFSGEPYDAAWRWSVNNRLSTMAFKLALLWRMEADAACLRRCEAILTGYADRYPGYPVGPEAPYGQGKATFQPLDESVWIIPLARAYDLIRDCLPSDARARVEADLLLAAARHILGQKYRRIHNIECWMNAAIGTVGACLGDEGLVRESLEGEFGFFHQLEEGVRKDGLWWEGSSSYHFYALAALMTHAQVLEGRELHAEGRLREMFRAPVALAFPDFTLPATNDCWFFTSLLADVCHGVPPAAAFYEVAYGWYEDPIFAWVLNRNYERGSRTALESLIYGGDLPEARVRFRLAGTVFEPSGIAVLRSQDPPERQSCLLLKYGPHGGGHGHPDKLAVSFYICGYPVSPDLGTPGYGIGLHRSWYRQSLSHNTVVVDGRSQPPAAGELVAFESGAQGDFGVADARVAWAEAPYEGVAMRRTILWMQDYFLDLFQVEASRERQFDWVCRFRGNPVSADGLPEGEAVALKGEGYEHVSAPRAAVADASVRLCWGLPDCSLGVDLPAEQGTRVVRGRAPLQPAAEVGDLLIRRRTARRTAFLTLVHRWRQAPAVAEVLPAPEGAWVLRVRTRSEDHLWALYPRELEGQVEVPAAETGRLFSYLL